MNLGQVQLLNLQEAYNVSAPECGRIGENRTVSYCF